MTLIAAASAVMPLTSAAQDVTTVWEQSFETATAGSETTPEAFPAYGTGSFSTLFGYSWSQKDVMSAGGCILIKDGGYIYRNVSASSSKGAVKVTAEVKAGDSYGGAVTLKFGSASNMVILSDNEWHTVSAIFAVSGYSNQARLEPFLMASGMFVKSMKVEQSLSFLSAPIATQPVVADGTSFTATWRSVSGATGYFLDVYSYNVAGDQKEYVIENQNVGTVTSYKVTGLDAAKTYYFVVRSTNGEATSDNSNEIKVVKVISSIDAPAVKPASNVTATGFTANWEAVADASGYIVNLYKHETLKADGLVPIFTEDFSKVTLGSTSSTEFGSMNVNTYTSADGWDGTEFVLAGGAIGLYPLTAEVAYVTTPALDLSKDSGKFSVTFRLQCGSYGTFTTGAKPKAYLLDKDDNVIETKEIEIDSKEYKDYVVEFTQGSAESKIKLEYTKDASATSLRIFVDGITVSQMRSAGDVVTDKIEVATAEAGETSHDFMAEFADNVEYSYGVVALAETVVSGEIGEITSAESDLQKVSGSTGVADNVADSVAVMRVWKEAAGTVGVELGNASRVVVYDIAGRVLYSGVCPEGVSSIDVAADGVVVVKSEAGVAKVAL